MINIPWQPLFISIFSKYVIFFVLLVRVLYRIIKNENNYKKFDRNKKKD